MKTFILLGGLLFFSVFVDAQTKHVVQRGETLELIADRYGVAAKLIKDANPLVDEYYTGLTLLIPNKFEPNENDNRVNKDSFTLKTHQNIKTGNIEKKNGLYKDRIIYDLKGNVKQCILYVKDESFGEDEFEECLTDEFEINGMVVHNDDYLIKRDEENRIVQTQNRPHFENFSGDNLLFISFLVQLQLISDELLCVDYTYDIDGRIKSKISWQLEDGKSIPEYSSEVLYFYNTEGYVVKEIDKDLHEEAKRMDLVKEYEYLSFDEKGNWTQRVFIDPVRLGRIIQKRIITYY